MSHAYRRPVSSQAEVSAEIAAIATAYARAAGDPAAARLPAVPHQPAAPPHQGASTTPTRRASSCGRRCFGQRDVDPLEADLTIQHRGEPLGERIVVTGRVLDGDGRPVAGQLVEIWQANAGRPLHPPARPAPGAARPATSPASAAASPTPTGRYRFTTIKPGPYPWRNHRNAWRPAHIHFSLFGTEFTQRMITQMYFPGDPLFALDPIYQSIVDPSARERLVATLRPRPDRARVVHRLPLGHRADRPAPHPDGGDAMS